MLGSGYPSRQKPKQTKTARACGARSPQSYYWPGPRAAVGTATPGWRLVSRDEGLAQRAEVAGGAARVAAGSFGGRARGGGEFPLGGELDPSKKGTSLQHATLVTRSRRGKRRSLGPRRDARLASGACAPLGPSARVPRVRLARSARRSGNVERTGVCVLERAPGVAGRLRPAARARWPSGLIEQF